MRFLASYDPRYPCGATYPEAKLEMLKLWTPYEGHLTFGQKVLPVCAICLKPIRHVPAAHHVILSSRYEASYRALWNLAPVHQLPEGNCHERHAHGGCRDIIIQRLYYIVGGGDVAEGREIIVTQVAQFRFGVELPEPIEGDILWKINSKTKTS